MISETGESLGLPYLGPKYQEAYRTALKQGTRTVRQSRVMIDGHSGAGKTSLLRCLLKQPFVEEHIPTIGFEVNKTTDWTLQEGSNIEIHTIEKLQTLITCLLAVSIGLLYPPSVPTI